MASTFNCRLCADLKSTLDVVFIKKNGGIKKTIFEKVLECFRLNFENPFPSSVCADCWVHATSMYDFYKKVVRSQDVLRDTSQATEANVQVKSNNVDPPNIKVEVEETSTHSVHNSINLKNETGIEFGKDGSDLDNKEDCWTSCDIDMEDGLDDPEDEWNEPLSSMLKVALVNDEKPTVKKKKVQTKKKTTNETKNRKNGGWKDWQGYRFYCTLCPNDFTRVSELRKHFKYKHDNKPTEYKCTDCGKYVSTKYPNFRAHVKKHQDKFKYCCKPCNKFFHSNARYQMHMSHVHKEGDIQKCICEVCGKSFELQATLRRHTLFAHLPEDEKNRYECDICHKRVSTASNLVTHKKVHEDAREHTCEHCGLAFKHQGTLKYHIIHKHVDLKDIDMAQCPDCPKMFKDIYGLKRHQRIHMETELFHCEVCARPFKHKRALRRHSSIHSNMLPFECEYCKKCFRQKSFLKIHLRQHTGEKPYSCTECNQRFTNDSNFIKHIRVRHGLEQFSIANQSQFPFVNPQ